MDKYVDGWMGGLTDNLLSLKTTEKFQTKSLFKRRLQWKQSL